MMRQRGILPRQVQLWRKQSSSPVRHSAAACWDHLCAHKTQRSLKIVSLFKKEIRDKSMVKIDHLFISLSSAPRFPCLTLPTPSQTHEEIIVGHVLACWAIPALSLFFFNSVIDTITENTSCRVQISPKWEVCRFQRRYTWPEWEVILWRLVQPVWLLVRQTHPQAVGVGVNHRVSKNHIVAVFTPVFPTSKTQHLKGKLK